MRDVQFLSVPSSWWERWRDTVLEVLVGLALLSATILWVTRGKLPAFFCFTPKSSTVQLQLYAAKSLAILSVALLVITVPIYHAGSNYFECGQPFLVWTMAYLSDSAAAEWSCAVATCVFVAMAVFGIEGLGLVASEVRFDTAAPEPEEANPNRLRLALLGIGWSFVSLILSIPSVLYALSTSLPSDNSLHISSGVLQVINRGIGGLLFVINAYIIPTLSRAASRWAVGGQVWLSGHLITATRSVITLLVPICVVITMNQDCFAKVNII